MKPLIMIAILLSLVSQASAATTPASPTRLRITSKDGNLAPVITGVPSKVAIAGSSYSFTPSASDPEGRPLKFIATNLPAWATLDPVTGKLSGVPAASDVGVYKEIEIAVSDGVLTNWYDKFTIEVVTSAIYVSTIGDDLNAGRTPDRPFKTVQKAADVAVGGDTIFLREGVYGGGMIRRPGTAAAWITLKPYPDEKAVIDGSLNDPRYPDTTLYFYNVTCDPYNSNYTVPCQAAYWAIDGLEVRGGRMYVIKIDQRFVKLVNNDLHGSPNDIIKVVKTGDDVTIVNNKIHDNAAVPGANAQAVDIVGADRAYVSNNHVYNIPSVGMFAKGNARDAIFESNVVENIYDRGIMLGQSTDAKSLIDGPYECYDCIARNNIVKNAQVGCFGISSAKNSMVYNNTCYMAAARGQAAIYLSKESEIGTRNCGVDIRNNIIHTAAATKRPVIKVGYQGMHSGIATTSDPAERCLDGFATLTVDNNVYWNESSNPSDVTFLWEDIGFYSPVDVTKWKTKTGRDTNSKIADPLFTDTATLAVKPDSPAVDAGVPLPQVTNDFELKSRPLGLRPDIGAYEQ